MEWVYALDIASRGTQNGLIPSPLGGGAIYDEPIEEIYDEIEGQGEYEGDTESSSSEEDLEPPTPPVKRRDSKGVQKENKKVDEEHYDVPKPVVPEYIGKELKEGREMNERAEQRMGF